MEKGTQACSYDLPNKIKLISLLNGNNKQLRNAEKKYSDLTILVYRDRTWAIFPSAKASATSFHNIDIIDDVAINESDANLAPTA